MVEVFGTVHTYSLWLHSLLRLWLRARQVLHANSESCVTTFTPTCGGVTHQPRRQLFLAERHRSARVAVDRADSYRAGLFALCGKKGCGESVTHRLRSWASVRCCEAPTKSKRRSHCMHSARATTPLWATCMNPSLRAGRKGCPQGMCEETLL